jgi:exopolyphosphatase/guanosine-5'-triphosphate,3'-diphosphate pyrophosphatase
MLHPDSQATLDGDYAAIDLGSNSFYLLVVRRTQDAIHITDRLRETVRLAQGVDHDGHLDPAIAQQALACLARFAERLSAVPRHRIRAVGTQAFRETKSLDSFLLQAGQVLGVPIEIIPGEEEARLIYRGISWREGIHGQNMLIFDIGGGSTELAGGTTEEPDWQDSIPMGCVSYSRRFFPTQQPISKNRLLQARLTAQSQVSHLRSRMGHPEVVYGASGSVRVVKLLLEQYALLQDNAITNPALDALEKQLFQGQNMNRNKLLSLIPDRAEVFPAGLAILRGVIDGLNLSSVQVTDAALREGIMVELVRPEMANDTREKTILSLQRRFSLDHQHGIRVADTAQALWPRLATAWSLTQEEADLDMLRHAACLHEIGQVIAHVGYHKHGAYLLRHAHLAGFTERQRHILVTLVRNHRRRLTMNARKLDAAQHSLLGLCITLRLAVLLNRNRLPQPLPPWTFHGTYPILHLDTQKGWLDQRPLLRADLAEEAHRLHQAKVHLRLGEHVL